ncbi:IS6 family transposase [Deinococcus saxicola]|uniref:IS6 family transposase n=1 Tax=Deinococcus saxicola TaxID=249406 RepID=UPI0039F022E5
MTEPKPYRHRFPMTIIQHAVWLYHRFPLSYRDVQELLHQRGIQVSHETLREWCVKFGSFFAEHLRHREPRRGSRWYLDEMCTTVDGVRHWLWRAVDEHGYVLDILLQRHRDTEAAKTFLTRLLGEYDVPEVIHTDQLQSYGAAIRQIPSLADVDHQQVISTARCNNIVEQEHRSTRRQERSQQGFRRRKRAQAFLSLHARITNLHHHSRTSVCAAVRRSNQKRAFQTWLTVAAGVA